MTTTKSYSNNTRFFSMYRASLKNMLPFLIVTAILMLVSIGVVYISFLSTHDYSSDTFIGATMTSTPEQYFRKLFSTGIYMSSSQNIFVAVLLAIVALVSALVSNSYLHSKKMVDLYHSLPIRRPHLLAANFLASMTSVLLPFYAVSLITMAVQVIGYGKYDCFGAAYFTYLLADLVGITVFVAVVYLFTTFIAVNVGTVFDAFALTGVVGVTPVTVYLISGLIWSTNTYGASFDPQNIFLLLSPFTFFFQRFLYADALLPLGFAYNKVLVLYFVGAIVAAALFIACVVCYERRKSELAEQTTTESTFPRIAKAFASFCGAALFLGIFYNHALPARLLAMLFGAFLAGVIAELILARGMKNFRKGIVLPLVGGAVWCVLFVLTLLDVFGYAKRLPPAEQIQSVSINYRGRFESLSSSRDRFFQNYDRDSIVLTQPDEVQTVLQAHTQAVSDYVKPYKWEPYENGLDYPSQYLFLEYELSNGKRMVRNFNYLNVSALNTLLSLEDKDEFIRQNHALFFLDSLPDIPQTELIRSLSLFSPQGIPVRELVKPSDEQLRALLDAMQHDMLNESFEQLAHPTAPALGYLQLVYKDQDELSPPYADTLAAMSDSHFFVGGTATVLVNPHYTRTIEALKAMDLYDALAAPEISIDSAILMPANYGYNGIAVATPDSDVYYRAKSDYDQESGFVEVTSPTDLAALQQAARNQLLYEQPLDGSASDLLVIRYFSGDIQYTGQFIRVQDLPANLRPLFEEEGENADFAAKEHAGGKTRIIGGADGSTAIVVS